MVFITILLFAVAYIFAIVGVVFFESYSIPDRPDLNYQHSFRSDNSCKRLKCCNRGATTNCTISPEIQRQALHKDTSHISLGIVRAFNPTHEIRTNIDTFFRPIGLQVRGAPL